MRKGKIWLISISLSVLAVALAVTLVLTRVGQPLHAADYVAYGDDAASHDMYNPARTALVNARRQLAETFRQEQDILVQRQRVHRELLESLKLLENAENLDPSMAEPIEDLKQRISTLERDPCASQFDDKSLKELYDELLADFETLIGHY